MKNYLSYPLPKPKKKYKRLSIRQFGIEETSKAEPKRLTKKEKAQQIGQFAWA